MVGRKLKADGLPDHPLQTSLLPNGPSEQPFEAVLLRPTFGGSPADSPREPMKVSGALGRIGGLIKLAQERADEAEQQAREDAARIRQVEDQFKAARERADTAERALQFVTSRTEEALAAAEAELRSALEKAEALARDLDLRTEQLGDARVRLTNAEGRALAAEASALEAKQDLACLETAIRQTFTNGQLGSGIGQDARPKVVTDR